MITERPPPPMRLMCLAHGCLNYGSWLARVAHRLLIHPSFHSSRTHLSALRPPQCPPIALYRPHHPPTRWHLHRVTTVTATLSQPALTHTLSHAQMFMQSQICTHKFVKLKIARAGPFSDISGRMLLELYTHTLTRPCPMATSWTQPSSVPFYMSKVPVFSLTHL